MSMFKKILSMMAVMAVITTIAFGFCLPVSASVPAISNPGFELYENNVLTGWSFQTGTAVVVTPGTAGYKASPDGGNYVSMPAIGEFVKQSIIAEFEPGCYELSLWVKYEASTLCSAGHKFGARISLYAYKGKDNVGSKDFDIYNTRGEWRQYTALMYLTEGTNVLAINLRSQTYALPSLAFDGVTLNKIEGGENTVADFDMNDVTTISVNETDTLINAEGIPFSAHNTDGATDFSTGYLGVNYIASTDTPDGTGYSIKLTNDGTVPKLNMLYYLPAAIKDADEFELSGYIKIEQGGTGKAVVECRRYYPNTGNLLADSTAGFSSTSGRWEKFSYRLKYKADTTDSYTPIIQLTYTGSGSVLFDNLKVTKVYDTASNAWIGDNLVINGDCEAIGSSAANGVYTPGGIWKVAGTGFAWGGGSYTGNTNVGAYVTTDNPHGGRYCLKLNMNDANADGWIYLNSNYLALDRLYQLSWWQRTDSTSNTSQKPRINIEFPTTPTTTYASVDCTDSAYQTTDWNRYTCYFKVPPTNYSRMIHIRFRPQRNCVYYVDDVILSAVDEELSPCTYSAGENSITANCMNYSIAESASLLNVCYVVENGAKLVYDIKLAEGKMELFSDSDIVFYKPADLSAVVSTPSGGQEYVVETMIWDTLNSLVPVRAKTQFAAD